MHPLEALPKGCVQDHRPLLAALLPPVARKARRHTLTRATLQAEAPEVTIRRLPPDGVTKQACGPVSFSVPERDMNRAQNILEEIVWYKAQEIRRMRELEPLAKLQSRLKLAGPSRDFIGALRAALKQTGRPGLIAEVKKASPSKGVICSDFHPVKVHASDLALIRLYSDFKPSFSASLRIAKAYEEGGAACLSVLTDNKYFQGNFEYLRDIRKSGVQCPLLCKEFIVEAYQLVKARAYGADCVLLIAAVLPNKDLEALVKVAQKLGLQCLVEVHTIAELERILKLDVLHEKCMLGINNRDLQTFKVDLGNNKVIMESEAGRRAVSKGLIFAGESGINTPEDVRFVKDAGCEAVLVGESLVKQEDVTAAVKALLA